MSQENVELIRRVVAAFRARDASAEGGFSPADLANAAALLHPDVVADTTRAPVEDIRGVWRGLAGTAEFWAHWLDSWEDLDFDAHLSAGTNDTVVAAVPDQRMRGRSSGIEVQFPPFWVVFTLHEGKVIRYVFYADEREALDAAGL